MLCSPLQEVAELREQIKDSKVIVQMDSRKGNDLSDVIAKIRHQYEKVAAKNREETESWYQGKVKWVGQGRSDEITMSSLMTWTARVLPQSPKSDFFFFSEMNTNLTLSLSCSHLQFETVKAEVIENTEALQKERNLLSELRRQRQALEIDLQAAYSQVNLLSQT